MKKIIIVTATLALTAMLAAAQEAAENVSVDTTAAAASTDTAAIASSADTAAAAATDTSVSDTASVAADTVSADTTAAVATDTLASDTPSVAIVDTANTTSAHSKKTRGGYLLSIRPEFALVHGDISSVGGVAEVGMIWENGLFMSLDFGGGAHYAGGGLNVGYFFGSRGMGMKSAVGYTMGYYNTDIVVKFESESGDLLKRFVGSDVGVTGLFWKLAVGSNGHVDITSRIMTGFKAGSVWYNETDGVYKEDGFAVRYSVSLGYTFIGRKQ